MSNSIPTRYPRKNPIGHKGIWQGTVTAAQITAGVTVVPPVANYQFIATNLLMRGQGGTCSGPTTIDFQETTSNGVIMSHVSADLTAAAWNLTSGGTVVTTKLGVPLVVSEGVKIVDTGGSANTAMTTMDYVIEGYYIPRTGRHNNV
jgi:hypothetical protein